jgi:hypothetical protein
VPWPRSGPGGHQAVSRKAAWTPADRAPTAAPMAGACSRTTGLRSSANVCNFVIPVSL